MHLSIYYHQVSTSCTKATCLSFRVKAEGYHRIYKYMYMYVLFHRKLSVLIDFVLQNSYTSTMTLKYEALIRHIKSLRDYKVFQLDKAKETFSGDLQTNKCNFFSILQKSLYKCRFIFSTCNTDDSWTFNQGALKWFKKI